MEGFNITELVFELRMPYVKFGNGALYELGYDFSKLKLKKVLIITDDYINKKTDYVERAISSFKQNGIEADVWDGVEPEPSDVSIQEGIEYAKRANYDSFVAIGGGSCIDTAKLIDLYTTYPAELTDYFAPPIGKGLQIPGPIKFLAAVPTTSGTGSETTGTAVVTFVVKKSKFGITHEYLIPKIAVLDPLLTTSMPPKLTATTGIDALMHAIEAYLAKPYNTRERPQSPLTRPAYQGSMPITDILAEKAILLIGEYLPKAYANGLNIEARANMHLAAFIAGVAFGNAGVHLAHALALPLSAILMDKGVKLPHGIAVGVFGPGMLKVLEPFYPKRCSIIANYLSGGAIPHAHEALLEFIKTLGLPSSLHELGVTEKDIDALVDAALMNKRLLLLSPIVPERDVLKRIAIESLQQQ
ncbi:MAG: hydroxyacid-oxoacid transhydrogenase [Nitrososphaerota archaeon]|nr:iron-containing alcohol dehydrogenase [Aigarchaeota archaeon]MDW8076767.1 hydroxyacid-oxoacid transhydrogenase [Nitrososphaerota archaeon]